MMQAADVHGFDVGTPLDEPRHRFNVTGEKNARPRICIPLFQLGGRLLHGSEIDVHFWRYAHAIELLLPLAGGHLVIDQRNEAELHRLSPANDDLPVDQAVVDPEEFNGHRACPRRERSPWRAPQRSQPLRAM